MKCDYNLLRLCSFHLLFRSLLSCSRVNYSTPVAIQTPLPELMKEHPDAYSWVYLAAPTPGCQTIRPQRQPGEIHHQLMNINDAHLLWVWGYGGFCQVQACECQPESGAPVTPSIKHRPHLVQSILDKEIRIKVAGIFLHILVYIWYVCTCPFT